MYKVYDYMIIQMLIYIWGPHFTMLVPVLPFGCRNVALGEVTCFERASNQ